MRSLKKIKQRYRYSVILLRELVRTDFKVRYQGSVLGYLWSLLRPLFLFVILYVVFVYFLKIGKGVPHWPVALLLGTVLWNFFAEITNQGLRAIVSKGGLIRKINFPKYVILFATSASALINLFFNLTIVAVFMFINHVDFSWTILMLPVYVLEILIFGLGLSFILSTLYVRYRDMNFIWEILMQALFYGSAILYPVSRIADAGHHLAQILLLNPVAQAVQDARYAVVSHKLETLNSITGPFLYSMIPIVIVVLVFVLGGWLFKRRSPSFAEEA